MYKRQFQGRQYVSAEWQALESPRVRFLHHSRRCRFRFGVFERSTETDAPFYLYVAFNAPHAPLHALPEDYAKYKGRYDEGWDNVRNARIEKQKKLGIVPEELAPNPRPPHVRAWDKLVPWQRDFEINRMVTLAAMIDRVDQEIGRLVDDLREHNELENTLIVFVSDNGACPYDRRKPQLNVEPTNGDISFSDSTGWAWARNAPFRFCLLYTSPSPRD